MAEEKPGYCYSDASSSGNQNILVNQFEQAPEMYTIAADMIGFPPKNNQPENASVFWKSFFAGKGNHHQDGVVSMSDYYQHDFGKKHDLTVISDTTNETLMVSPPDSSSAWNHHHQQQQQQQQQQQHQIEDDQSLRCVFTCEGNERPSQGLSLSLSSSNPSSIGLQSFELRQHHDDLRFGPSTSRSVNIQQQPQMMEEYSFIRNSKYLGPAQELLNEFCNLGTKQNDTPSKMKAQKNSEWQDENAKKQSLYSLDLLDLQRRKSKLLQMLDEVDRRYKHYCDQMKGVTSSFEAVAGNGAAKVYSALASRAMSRHFRCLRDGIVNQIKATKKAMGEKDIAAPGTVKGETPRLRLLDQTLRQQKALQQMSMMEAHPWRPQRGLPERSVSVLRAWLFEHFLHPYPSDVDKHILARQTGLSRSQVSNWFINARVRLWKPMVEEMYMEEQKENENSEAADDIILHHPNPSRNEDQKPSHNQLNRIDSECLSSIINNSEKNSTAKKNKLQNEHQNPSFSQMRDSYGAMELDFSSYNAATTAGVQNYGGGGNVSLTLGLHQHREGGVSLAFSSASQSSIFYPRVDPIEDCQTVPYSLLDSEGQTLPYRNLMGAQLLHDLAG